MRKTPIQIVTRNTQTTSFSPIFIISSHQKNFLYIHYHDLIKRTEENDFNLYQIFNQNAMFEHCNLFQEYIQLDPLSRKMLRTMQSLVNLPSVYPQECQEISSMISVGVTCHEKTGYKFLFGHNN